MLDPQFIIAEGFKLKITMKTKQQIIKDQESIGNIQTTRDEWGTLDGEGECVIKVYAEKEILYFKPKPEYKRVFEDNNRKFTIDEDGILIESKNISENYITISESLPLLLEAIKEAERQGLWK